MNRKIASAIIILAVLLSGLTSAFGETIYLDYQGIRFYTPAGWQTITQANVLENELLAKALGTSPEMMKAQLDAHNILLYAIDENQNAFTLRVLNSPLKTYTGDVYAFSNANRSEFSKALLAANANAQGDWDETLPHFLCLNWKKDVQGVPVYTLAYQTLMYGQIISFECDSFGGAPTLECVDSLQRGAAAILFLGAKTNSAQASSALTLPEATPNDGVAELNYTREAIPLVPDELPASISMNELVVTGTTAPNANLRYYMNGAGIERFKSDDDGRFEITVNRFKEGANTFRIDSGTDQGGASFTTRITLAQDPTPAALSRDEITWDAPILPIQGLTLPDAAVSFAVGTKTTKVPVNEDGSFTAEISLPSIREYTVTFEFTSKPYKRNKLVLLVHRIGSAEEETAAFLSQKGAAAKLNIAATGEITDLRYDGAKRLVIFSAEDQTNYAVYVDNFLNYDLNQKGQMLLIATDEVFTLNGVDYPVAVLNRFNPLK